MGLRLGSWKTITIAQSGTESSETDLGAIFRNVLVYSPALDSATLTVKVSRVTADTAVQVHTFKVSATGDVAKTTTAKTAAAVNVFDNICGQFITLVVGASQTSAARTFYARGIDPL
jgi:hypothetical protein